MDRKAKKPNEHLIALRDKNLDIELSEDLVVKTDGEKMLENLHEEIDYLEVPKDTKFEQSKTLRPKKG